LSELNCIEGDATTRPTGRMPPHAGYALSVGGLVMAVAGHSARSPFECALPARPFLASAKQADLLLEARWQELEATPRGRLLFDSGGVWRAYEDAGTHVIRCHDARHPQFPYKEARVFPGSTRGEVLLDPRLVSREGALDPLEFPLDELLFQHLLRALGGVELHAAGVVSSSGRGYLFAGQSGDGKTTTARLWQSRGATVLSDDRIVVRRADAGDWRMYGTPWHGEAELAAAASAPLQDLFVLARGETNELEPLEPAAAVATLFARGFPAFYEPSSTARLLAQLETLVRDVPCRLFRFVPGDDPVGFILAQGV
jgi:hypothetical protein